MPFDLKASVQHLLKHGYVVICDSGAPVDLLEDVKVDALNRARTRAGSRTSINDWSNIERSAWWRLLEWCIDPLSVVGAVIDATFGDCWFYDVAGGEAIVPRAPWTGRECSAHSDWKGVPLGVIAASFIVNHNATVDMAPLIIYSKFDGTSRACVGPFGTVILRDVSTIHHGSPNLTDTTVIKPCVRFLTAEALQRGYRPRPFIPASQYSRFDVRTFRKLHFCFDSELEQDRTNARRFETPPSLGFLAIPDADEADENLMFMEP